MASNPGEYATTLGADAVFKGELTFESGARFLGRFEGSVESKGKIMIADGAACHASVSAKEVAVDGVIEGNVDASDRIEVGQSGKVMGDITAARMTMAEGATVNGYCRIGSAARAGAGSKPQAQTETKPDGQSAAKPRTTSKG